MVASIPASDIVNVLPGVISAGGNGLDMVGLILTNSARIPTGVVLSFPSADAVSDYFGASSDEAAKATVYFGGYDGSVNRPAFVLFAAFATAARAAFVRGAPLSLTLAQLQALSGTLIVTANGTQYTSATINLSGATSFSNAATLIQSAFTAPPFTVTYDSVSGAFLFTTTTTGDAATISFATGTLAAGLGLTSAAGAVQSAGSDADVALTAMDDVIALSQDFVSFTTLFAATDDQIVDFATWTDGRNDRFLYVPWTSSSAATTNTDTTSPAKRIAAANLSGTAPIWSPSADKAVFVLGYIASIDFNRTNGRTTAAFRSGGGLTADVTNQTIARNLEANGYSFYGTYGTANDAFTWLYNGQVSGDFAWIDSYVNQVWLNNRFQLTLMTALGTLGQIPYNDDGYEMIAASLTTDISAAVDFGAIRAGVTLTDVQKQQIAALAGQDISAEMFARGWYLSVKDPGAEARAERGSPICTFFYTDGQSVQRITLSSLMVQ
jgi:Protein of unknown function (DUF3383).